MKPKAAHKPSNTAAGFYSVSQDEMRQILDANARKLVGMSGDQALRTLRTRKPQDPNGNWSIIKMLASMLD